MSTPDQATGARVAFGAAKPDNLVPVKLSAAL
jgi:hypothetical protein